jgi:ABC-type glycerol-3-phosphate transport system substrate-binding protein
MAGNRVVRVYQEDWWPFQNLPAALRRFTAETGIGAELSWDRVGVGSIEKMFEEMLHSFTDEDPPFDVVCTDEVMLRKFAAEGRVLVLNDLMARDGIGLDDVTAATREAVTLDGEVLGLPCVNVSNMLLFRRDLLERYGLAVPQSWGEVKEVGGRLQEAVRKDGTAEFYGFATRGAPGGGHAVWTVSSFLASYGAAWFDAAGRATAQSEAHEAALATYVDLLRAVAPPDQARISFVELMRDFRAGRVGMVLEVGMEYAHLLRDNPELGAKAGVALVPAGPAGRFANLYCPPYAIPKNSKLRAEAWELLKFLCAPAQLLDDGQKAEALETSSLAVLYSPQFDRHFRPDLLAVTRASRAIAFEERPFSTLGIDACTIVGDHTTRALTGELGIRAALERMQQALERLPKPARISP